MTNNLNKKMTESVHKELKLTSSNTRLYKLRKNTNYHMFQLRKLQKLQNQYSNFAESEHEKSSNKNQ